MKETLVLSTKLAILSTMKHLYIIRHAKSDWSDPTLDDFDRGLNGRGKKSIPIMGHALREKGICPDLILASPAKRAKLTAQGLSQQLSYDGVIRFDDSLYFCNPSHWIETIQTVEDSCETLFVIGHNPELTELVNQLQDEYIDNVPTLGIVGLQIDVNKWASLSPAHIKKAFFIYPKMYQ